MADLDDRAGAFGEDRIEALARAIHAGYRRHQREGGATPGPNAADVPWGLLAEAFRELNRNHAADITRKLAAVGCVAEPMGPARPSSEPLFAFLPAEVELLAEMEHQRWSRERVSQGWTPGPERDDTARRTPYLVPVRGPPGGDR